MTQIITNGLSNAGKFTMGGVVAVDVAAIARNGHDYLVITVTNTKSAKAKAVGTYSLEAA